MSLWFYMPPTIKGDLYDSLEAMCNLLQIFLGPCTSGFFLFGLLSIYKLNFIFSDDQGWYFNIFIHISCLDFYQSKVDKFGGKDSVAGSSRHFIAANFLIEPSSICPAAANLCSVVIYKTRHQLLLFLARTAVGSFIGVITIIVDIWCWLALIYSTSSGSH